MKKLIRKIAMAATLAGMLGSAAAAPLSLDITWSGAAVGNSASATGQLSLDDSLLVSNGTIGGNDPLLGELSVTVVGATAGNGSYGKSSFGSMYFRGAAGLDFSKELIGQILGNGCAFGTSQGTCGFGNGGDFNLFSNNGGPTGTWWFQLTTQGGDAMQVTSIRSSDIPEPASLALFGLAAAGLAAARRKQA